MSRHLYISQPANKQHQITDAILELAPYVRVVSLAHCSQVLNKVVQILARGACLVGEIQSLSSYLEDCFFFCALIFRHGLLMY